MEPAFQWRAYLQAYLEGDRKPESRFSVDASGAWQCALA